MLNCSCVELLKIFFDFHGFVVLLANFDPDRTVFRFFFISDLMEAETAALGQDPAMVEKTIAEMIGSLEKLKQELDSVVKAYNIGDKETLIRYFTAEAARSSVDGNRNARFLEAAQKALKDGGRTLIAIGEYHIIAEDGLVNTLTQAGCTVTPVK